MVQQLRPQLLLGPGTPWHPEHHDTDHGHFVTYPDAYRPPAGLPMASGERHVHDGVFAALTSAWGLSDPLVARSAGSAAKGEVGWIWAEPGKADAALDHLADVGFSHLRAAIAYLGPTHFNEMKLHLSAGARASWKWAKVVAAIGRLEDPDTFDHDRLRTWFMAMPDDEIRALVAVFGWRFGVAPDAGAWSGPALRRAWTALEPLPALRLRKT